MDNLLDNKPASLTRIKKLAFIEIGFYTKTIDIIRLELRIRHYLNIEKCFQFILITKYFNSFMLLLKNLKIIFDMVKKCLPGG